MTISRENRKKFLSIITVCLNDPQLERTCESIINQIYQNYEWIVIDGGSDKKTLSTFKKYKKYIHYFLSEKDNGIYDAMNKGISYASGVWVNFMNAGDMFVQNNTLYDVCKELNKYDKYEVIYGNGIQETNYAQIIKYTPAVINKYFFCNDSLFHQSIFFKRDLFNRYGCFDIHYKIVSDWLYTFMLWQKGILFKHIDYIIAKNDKNGISVTNQTLSIAERMKVMLKLFSGEEAKKIISEDKMRKNVVNRLRKRVNNAL